MHSDVAGKERLEPLEPLEPTTQFDYEGRINDQYDSSAFRSGFVSIVGAPNMGKSTLLNELLDQDLCITTPRPQTTRHAIMAVLTSEEHQTQLAFIDTPGVIESPSYKLQSTMMEAVKGSLNQAEVIMVLSDVFSTVPLSEDDAILTRLQKTNQKVIVVVNKIDLLDKVKNFNSTTPDSTTSDSATPISNHNPLTSRTTSVPEAVAKWRMLLPNALAIIPISCTTKQNIPTLKRLLLAKPDVPAAFRDLGRPVPGTFAAGKTTVTDSEARDLFPVAPPLYPFDQMTDRTERFFASEIIRSVLFKKLGKELPYCCEVAVTAFTELEPDSKNKVRHLSANIVVERESQKGIVVGKKGAKVKEVGISSRQKLEASQIIIYT
ncbi:hypothetical protein TL16_g01271 [Triparma laevis f. inornata]|uniref:Era-type G domain-containing protein n=1 Tax=Triparma laevis f. inornata TaxID=1714386 RepID=A0A9W7DRL7_9STRA|nr:hypothetical protein TL16_g01271 [Triparma laevis f. inornata]